MADSNVVQQVEPLGEAYEGGSGPLLILLHGLGGTWHVWRPVLALLEKRHRVLALTLPGHAGGPPLPVGAEPTVDLIADVLIEELHRRGVTRAHVAGNSLGGWLSLELARRRVAQSVTALSPAGGWRTPEDYDAVSGRFRIVFALIAVMVFLFSLLLHFGVVRRLLNAQAMEHGDRMSPDEARGAMKSLRRTAMLPRLLDNMGRYGPIRPMPPTGIPVRIAWCEHDKVIPFDRYGQGVIDAVPGAESVTVTGVGHVPMYDDPEQVAAVILATTARGEGAVA